MSTIESLEIKKEYSATDGLEKELNQCFVDVSNQVKDAVPEVSKLLELNKVAFLKMAKDSYYLENKRRRGYLLIDFDNVEQFKKWYSADKECRVKISYMKWSKEIIEKVPLLNDKLKTYNPKKECVICVLVRHNESCRITSQCHLIKYDQ